MMKMAEIAPESLVYVKNLHDLTGDPKSIHILFIFLYSKSQKP